MFGFGQFMDVHYDKVCDLILRHKESKDSIIRKTVITLIPHMAAYDPQGFCDEHHSGGTTTIMGFSFLTVSMRFLLGQLKKPEKAFGTVFPSPPLPLPDRQVAFQNLRMLGLTRGFSSERGRVAFLSIGHVAAKVGTEMKGFLDGILTAIQDGLSQRGCVPFPSYCSPTTYLLHADAPFAFPRDVVYLSWY